VIEGRRPGAPGSRRTCFGIALLPFYSTEKRPGNGASASEHSAGKSWKAHGGRPEAWPTARMALPGAGRYAGGSLAPAASRSLDLNGAAGFVTWRPVRGAPHWARLPFWAGAATPRQLAGRPCDDRSECTHCPWRPIELMVFRELRAQAGYLPKSLAQLGMAEGKTRQWPAGIRACLPQS